eukprot:scaffold330276_cov34-Prasinocladus_malaysianus.AAC.1
MAGALARRGADLTEERPSSLAAMLQDPRGFSGVPAGELEGHTYYCVQHALERGQIIVKQFCRRHNLEFQPIFFRGQVVF